MVCNPHDQIMDKLGRRLIQQANRQRCRADMMTGTKGAVANMTVASDLQRVQAKKYVL